MATRRLFASSSCALAPPRPDKPRQPDWIPDRLAAEVALVLRTENCTSRPGKFGVERIAGEISSKYSPLTPSRGVEGLVI